MPRAINKCPNCGSTVSQFAAGCAICGVQRNLALIAVAIALIVVLLVSFVPESVPWLWPWVNLQGPIPS